MEKQRKRIGCLTSRVARLQHPEKHMDRLVRLPIWDDYCFEGDKDGPKEVLTAVFKALK